MRDTEREIVAAIESIVEAEIAARSQSIQLETQRTAEQMAARGMSQSGIAVGAFGTLFEGEMEVRIRLIESRITEAASLAGEIDPEFEGALHNEIDRWIAASVSELTPLLARCEQLAGGPTSNRVERTADARRGATHAKLKLAALGAASGRSTGPTFNIGGSVGAIQTGSHATASVQMGLSEAEKRKLLDALDSLTANLKALPELGRGDASDVVAEIRSEAIKPSPNMLRIKSLGIGLAATVQSVASLQPAYKALCAALTLIGVHLPNWP